MSVGDAEKIFMDGRLVPASKAVISVDDRAVLYGEGVFETVRAYGGKPFRLDRHLDRMWEACRLLRMAPPIGKGEVEEAVGAVIRGNGLVGVGDSRVRITFTGGPSDPSKGLSRSGPAGIVITARPYTPMSESLYRKGLELAVSGIKRNTSSPVSSNKTLNYMDSLLARQDAMDRGADDAVMLSSAGNVAEATSSNIFMVKDGNVLTPDVGCGFLPGVTREAVIELCGVLRLTCTPVTAPLDVLLAADEVFLTNSMIEVMPVRRVGTRAMPRCPGSVTMTLAGAYRELVESNGVRHPS